MRLSLSGVARSLVRRRRSRRFFRQGGSFGGWPLCRGRSHDRPSDCSPSSRPHCVSSRIGRAVPTASQGFPLQLGLVRLDEGSLAVSIPPAPTAACFACPPPPLA